MQSADLSLQIVPPDAAGVNIGNECHHVVVPPDRDSQPVRHFGCTTAELRTMADWLKKCEIRTVAMQSTVRRKSPDHHRPLTGIPDHLVLADAAVFIEWSGRLLGRHLSVFVNLPGFNAPDQQLC